MSKLDLPISEWFKLGSKEGAEARAQYIKENADYYTVTFRKDYQNRRAELPTLALARAVAQEAANEIERPVMIYGVIRIPDTENGYDSLVETVKPDGNKSSASDQS